MIPFADAIPIPDSVEAGDTVAWFFTIWGGGASLAVLPWCILQGTRKDNWLPVLMWIGGAIAIVPEPIIDHLCYLWWPEDLPGPVVTGWDIEVPLFIPFAYAFFVGLTAYFGYAYFKDGVTIKQVWMVWAIFIAADLVLEYPGVWLGAYEYYGEQPFFVLDLPLWVTWINATGMLLGAFILYLAAPLMRGWGYAFTLMIPMLGYMTSWFVLAWPNYMALEWEPGALGCGALGLLSLVSCLGVVRGVAAVVTDER